MNTVYCYMPGHGRGILLYHIPLRITMYQYHSRSLYLKAEYQCNQSQNKKAKDHVEDGLNTVVCWLHTIVYS